MPFAYGDSVQRNAQNKLEALLGDACLSYLYDEKEGDDDNGSWDTTTEKMTPENEDDIDTDP